MALKVFTQKEFDAIPRDSFGHKVCPTGNYSQIKEFPPYCEFGDESIFSAGSSFGRGTIFGEWCRFGDGCRLADNCWLAHGCRFGNNCELGNNCTLTSWCIFGDMCIIGDGCHVGSHSDFGKETIIGNLCQIEEAFFDEGCTIGMQCRIGDRCIFKENVSFEGGKVCGEKVQLLKISYIGSHKEQAWFWKHNNGIYVRLDSLNSFGGDIDSFAEEIKQKYENDPQTLEEYLATIQYIKAVFGDNS